MNLSTGSFSYAQQQHRPQFHPTPRDGRYPVTINQNYIIGSTIIQVGCTDSLHNTTEFVYGIVPMTLENYFTINNVTGVISLAINARDLPGLGPHTAIIYCRNSNDLTGTVQLAVTYQIQNIHVPMFTNGDQVLNVSVREDHTEREGPIIAHLNVTDEDLEPCNIVIFTIVSGNNDGNFIIRSQSGSGIIELNNNLDYDSHPEKYTLTIRATNTECGNQRYSDELTVCVNVVNIDDEHPTFQQHKYTFTFDEGWQPLNFVQLRCLDSDSLGAQIVYEEGYTQNESPFAISHQTGYVSATEMLDYEQQISYNLTFTCYNVLKPNIRDTATVVVYLNPVNEHLPRVSLSVPFIRLNYTAPIGTLLISTRHDHHALINMTATDDDDGLDHGKIQFTLGQNNNNMYNSYFHMDSDSGDLILIRQFDFDVCSAGMTSFSLHIVVCDDLQNSSRYEICPTAICIIFVVTSSTPDLCELMFVEKNYTITVSELALPESELLQVHCVIPGGGPLQHHTIKIIPPNSSLSQTLRINMDRVILQEPLDYELVQNFTIDLNCSDSNGGLSITSLFIQVFPENDNPPYFEKPLYFFTIILPSNEKIIGSITALDDDLQIGNDITYSLVRNEFFEDDSEYFIVNKLENGSAVISMIKYPSHDAHYVFDIIANDSINTARSTVSVHILSVSSLASPRTSTEQCGTICIILLIILVTFMITIAAIVSLVCVRFCYAKKRKQQRPVSMANAMQLQDKSDTMGYCTIRQDNSLRRQKDEAFSQM